MQTLSTFRAEIVQSYRNCSCRVFGGCVAAGRYTCDCALCDEWPLNADVGQNYRPVSAGRLGGLALTGAMHLRGSAATQGYSQRPEGRSELIKSSPNYPLPPHSQLSALFFLTSSVFELSFLLMSLTLSCYFVLFIFSLCKSSFLVLFLSSVLFLPCSLQFITCPSFFLTCPLLSLSLSFSPIQFYLLIFVTYCFSLYYHPFSSSFIFLASSICHSPRFTFFSIVFSMCFWFVFLFFSSSLFVNPFSYIFLLL